MEMLLEIVVRCEQGTIKRKMLALDSAVVKCIQLCAWMQKFRQMGLFPHLICS